MRTIVLLCVAALLAGCPEEDPKMQPVEDHPPTETSRDASTDPATNDAANADATDPARTPIPIDPVTADQIEIREDQKIAYLLDQIERSGLTFIAGDLEYDAAGMAQLARERLSQQEERAWAAREFVDEIGGRSPDGHDFQVRFPDGRTLSAWDWLNGQLQDLMMQHRPQ